MSEEDAILKEREMLKELQRLLSPLPSLVRLVADVITVDAPLRGALETLGDALDTVAECIGGTADSASAWRALLADHPELGTLNRRTTWATLTYTDSDLLVALDVAVSKNDGASVRSQDVAALLGGVTHGDLCRVGLRLGALARLGLVERSSRSRSTCWRRSSGS